MSPVTNFAVLAFAASALAIPHSAYQHSRLHSASAVSRASHSHSGSRHPHSHSHSGSAYSHKSHHKSSTKTSVTADRAKAPGTLTTSTCTSDVTVTTVDMVTVYVTATAHGAASSSSATSTVKITTSSSVSSASSSSATATGVAATAAHYGGGNWNGNGEGGWGHSSSSATTVAAAAPSTSSSSVQTHTPTTLTSKVSPATTAPTTAPTTTSVHTTTAPVAVIPSVVASVVSSVVSAVIPSSKTSAAAATPTSYGGNTSSAGKGKRGLAYNDASLTQCFAGSNEISWAYNWGSSAGGTLPAGISYIPTLWSPAKMTLAQWTDVATATIKNKTPTMFSFNEPDHTQQANMSPADAAKGYLEYMNPFHGQGSSLCAPSVTNGGGSMGLSWLSSFLAACPTCKIDCINIHWYDSAQNVAYFKQHIQDTIAIAGGRPIYVSEFGATSGTDAEIAAFLAEVMPYMDNMPQIAGYAYFMVEQGVLVNNGSPSVYGKTYMASN